MLDAGEIVWDWNILFVVELLIQLDSVQSPLALVGFFHLWVSGLCGGRGHMIWDWSEPSAGKHPL